MTMRHPRRPHAVLLASSFLFVFAVGCANLGDPQQVNEDSDGDGVPDDDTGDGDPAQCTATGDSGEVCEVSGDCDAPLVCLNNVCVGPHNEDDHCDPIEGTDCDDPDAVCVGGACVLNPGACTSDDECPLGYVCDGSVCTPERDGQACADVGAGPDLNGTWKFRSTLHLREGLPNVVDGILDVAEQARDIIEGNLDLGLPGFVESLLGSAVASIIDNYVPQYAQNLVIALGDMSDVLDDMEVDSTVVFSGGQVCDGNYRGKETWNFIRYTLRGNEVIVRPDQLPGVSEIIPDEFAAWYSCGEVFIDRHRISNSLSGLVRFIVDNTANAITGYPDVESALSNMVDCYGFAVTLDNYLGSICSYCPIITNLADVACETAKNRGIQELSEAIDSATVKMSVLKKKGIGTVSSGNAIANGRWYGSLVGGDFPGEFTATRQ